MTHFRTFFRIFFQGITLICNSLLLSLERPITVVVPSYNNQTWCESNLLSILMQEYPNFKVIYIDDASTDSTYQKISDYLRKYDPDRKITLIRNSRRLGALANLFKAIHMCDPFDIIITIDGDDALHHPWVLNRINEIYEDENVWLTYGQFIEHPTHHLGGARQIPSHVIATNTFREYDWVSTHLRTFYAWLFQSIHQEDLMHEGIFFQVAGDLAFMFPLLEMAGFHSLFVPEILYRYNVDNPLNDRKMHYQEQIFLENVIRSRKKYSPVLIPPHRQSKGPT